MTLKALSTLYLYLRLDFKHLTMFLCFPWICKLHVWASNYYLDRCRIHKACCSVFMLFFIPIPRFQSKIYKYMFIFTISSCVYSVIIQSKMQTASGHILGKFEGFWSIGYDITGVASNFLKSWYFPRFFAGS